MTSETAIVRRLRLRPDLLALQERERRREIRIALMDVPGVDPDNDDLVRRIDVHLNALVPRFKTFTSMSDAELAKFIGKSRPTIQAYVGGRLPERLDAAVLDRMIERVELEIRNAQALVRDIKALRTRVA